MNFLHNFVSRIATFLSRYKAAIIITLVFSSGLLIASIWVIYRLLFSVEIEILVAPASSTIQLNGKNYKNGEHRLRPGDYKVKIEKDGFQNYETDFTAKANSKVEIGIILRELDSNGTFYRDNPSDASIAQAIGDRNFERDIDKAAKENPIGRIAPYGKKTGAAQQVDYWRLDIKWTDGKLDYLIVSSKFACGSKEIKESIKNDALKYIRDNGFNPEDYKVHYDLRCGG